MRFVGYGRVSRVGGREGEAFISPTVQRHTVEHMLAARGHDPVEWIEDLDESGGKWERAGLQRALQMVDDREVDGIAVAKLDRFARSVKDALSGIERIDAAGGQLLSAAENFDTTTPMGRAMLQIALVFAELERERQKEGFLVAKAAAIDRGVFMSAQIPFGYRRRDDKRLEPNDDAAVVRDIYQRRAFGQSIGSLVRWLDEAAPREGAWTRQTVERILSNRVYLGESRQGDLVNMAAHEPLVSRMEWEAVQPRRRGPRASSQTLLAGLLVCDSCGHPMTHIARDYYGCRRRRATGVCPRPVMIGISRADEAVEDVFLEMLATHPIRMTASAREADLAQAVAAVETAEAELAAYLETSLASVVGEAAFTAGAQTRARAIDAARRVLADAQGGVVVPLHGFDLEQDWPALELQTKRQLLAAAYDRIVCLSTMSGSRAPALNRLRFIPLGSDHEIGMTLTQSG